MKKFLATLFVALFATAIFGQTKVLIPTGDLPKCVPEYVKQNYKGFTIDKAYKISTTVNKEVIVTFNVKVVKGKEVQWLSVDNACKKFKKITLSEAETDPPKPMPPIKVGTEKEKTKESNEQPKK